MTIHLWVRYSSLVAAGACLLASCTVTEPLLYQGTTGSPPSAPVYAYQSGGVSVFHFIGTTQRITLTEEYDKTRVIDVVTQQDIHIFLQAPGGSKSFAETDSAGRIFVQADESRADVLDLATGKWMQSFKPVRSYGSRYTFLSPDGKVLFFDSRLWGVAKAEQIIELDDDPINSAAFSADGRYFARGGRFGTQWLDLQTKKVERLPDEAKTSQVQFGRDNRLYRSYGANRSDSAPWLHQSASNWMNEIAVSQLGDNKTRKTFEPRSRIACWALSPNHQVFAALVDGTLVWLDEDLKIQKQWHSELKVTACLPDKQQRVWLGTHDSGLLALYLEQGRLKQVLPSTIHWIKSVKLSSDENYLGLLLFRSDDPSRKVEIYKTAELE
jgi:WD40 repeat protein